MRVSDTLSGVRGIQLAPLLGCVLATIALSVGACGDATNALVVAKCVAGTSVACPGPSVCPGTQTCNSDGTYAACVCADAGIVDSGLPDVTVDSGKDAGIDASIDAAQEAAADAGLDAGGISWGIPFAGPNGRAQSVAVDSNQNVIVGAIGLVSLAKLDSMGLNVWQKVFADVYAVAVDSTGAIYASGDAPPGSDFGAGPVVAGGAYIAKFDAGGAYQWLYGPFANVSLGKLAVRSNGNVVAVGVLHNSQNLGAGPLSVVGAPDALLVELTPAGTVVRTKNYGDLGDQAMVAVTVDASNNLYVSGNYESGIDFGGGSMPGPAANSGTHDVFVVKLDASANFLKQIHLGSTGGDNVTGLEIDATGRLLFSGAVTTKMNFGGVDIVAVDNIDIVLAALDSSLVEVWSKRFGGATAQGTSNIAADPAGGFGIAGFGNSGLTFGLNALPSGQFMYAARFDSSGTPLSNYGTKVQGGSQLVQGIVHMTGSDYVVVGNCSGGPLPLPSGDMQCPSGNAFAARFRP